LSELTPEDRVRFEQLVLPHVDAAFNLARWLLRRGHSINVFIWPAPKPDAAPRIGSRKGYHWIDWRKGALFPARLLSTLSSFSSWSLSRMRIRPLFCAL
jgi:hypothetical protein